MFDRFIHLERRRPANRLRRITIEAERQLQDESIARWLSLGDEALGNNAEEEENFSYRAA